MADDPSAALSEIRENAKVAGATARTVRVPWPSVSKAVTLDLPRLLAAVDRVLRLADEALPVARDFGGEPIWWDLTPGDLREAITRELTGKAADDAPA